MQFPESRPETKFMIKQTAEEGQSLRIKPEYSKKLVRAMKPLNTQRVDNFTERASTLNKDLHIIKE